MKWIARDFKFHTGEVMPELRLHYTTIGARDGIPVVVLHGTGGKKEGELPILKRLANAGFIAVSIDGRFHGERGNSASYNAAMVVYLTEIIPDEVRASGFSLAYSLATAIGGFTPFIVTWLIATTGDQGIPGAWLSGAAVLSLIAIVLTMRRSQANSTVSG